MNHSESFHGRLAQIEELIEQLERSADPAVCDVVRNLTRCLLELHQKGIERLWQHLQNNGAMEEAVADTLLTDPLVANLLVLHDLHPLDLEQRLSHAIAQARDYVQAQSGELEVTSIAHNAVKLRLTPSCSSRQTTSAQMLRARVEELILAAAPDAVEVAVEVQQTSSGSPSFSGPELPIVDKPDRLTPSTSRP